MSKEPERNRLLALFPIQVKERVFPRLVEVELPLGKIIYDGGQKVKWVYFPADCIVSLLREMRDGRSVEISMVGCEGIIGTPVFMGGNSTISRADVRSAGTAYRLLASDLNREFDNEETVRTLLLRYTQALMTQMAQTAVCNRHHTIVQRSCRKLLLALDRLPSNQLTTSQELIANMLGVGLAGVTEAVGKLQKLGAIRYRCGRITLLDRPQVEELCCECYAVIKKETDRLEDYASSS